jgi:hypothetical protein
MIAAFCLLSRPCVEYKRTSARDPDPGNADPGGSTRKEQCVMATKVMAAVVALLLLLAIPQNAKAG